MNELYVVSTPYHLLIALADIIKKKKLADLVLTSNEEEDQSFYNNIFYKLKQIDLINDVYVIPARTKIKRFVSFDKEFNMIKKKDYSEVNIFPWNLYYAYSNSNKYINFFYKKGSRVNLFEDGKTMYLMPRMKGVCHMIKC